MSERPFSLLDCRDPILRADAQGITLVTVDDGAAKLAVVFNREATGPLLEPRGYVLSGGRRIFPKVVAVDRDKADSQGRRVILTLDQIGDFSVYTLTAVAEHIDPLFASRKLRFRLA